MTYNEIMQTAGKDFEIRVYYDKDGVETNISENYQDDFVSATPSFNAPLVGTVMKGIELELKVLVPNYPVYMEVTAIYESNSAIKTYGPYYFKENPTFNADTKTYTYKLYDEFVKTMIDYVPIDITYPCTLKAYFDTLLHSLNLTTNIVSLPNGNYELANDIYSGINFTFRSVIEDIAQANGILLQINGTQVEICNLGTEAVKINDDILRNENIDFGQHYGPINTIVLSRAGGSDKIAYPAGLEEEDRVSFTITDNQLMNNNDRDVFLPAIYNKLNGIEYDIYDTELIGYGGFKPLQKVEFESDNKIYTSYVFNNQEKFTDGYAESIYSEAIAQEETKYKATDTTDRRIDQVYIIADKQEKVITQYVGKTDKLEGDYTEIKTTVDGQTTEIGTIKGDVTTIKESIDGLQLSITKSGNNLIRNSMFYDFEGWSEIKSFRIARQDTPPTDITITNLWYCTKTNEYYENGKIYSGISGEEGIAWVLTDLLLSDLTKTNSGKPPVTFHLVSNAEIRQEYKSGSCLQIIVPEGYRNEYSLYSDIIDINNIEDTLTFSVRGIDKNEELANFSIRLWLYNDVNNLYKYIHSPIYETELPKQRGIIKNSFKIPRSTTTFNAVESNTEPTDTSQLWLKPLSDNTYSLYEYKDTWVLKQGQGVMAKDQNDTLYLPYGLSSMFSALKDSNGNKLNSFIPTQGFVELNYVRSAENVDNIVNVELGDMKLEYGEYSEWSPKRTEVVGTNHLLDETGYKISSGDDVMRIMIDEIAQYYKNNKMFYLNKTEGYIKNVISETSNVDGLITTSITVGGNKIYGRYIK